MTTPNNAAATLAVLHHKRDAELSNGAFSRYEPIPVSDRSRYSPTDPAARVELGLGYVQAILAALHGVVSSFSYDPPGLDGRLTHRSTGSSTLYYLSWRDRDGNLSLGGFGHSDRRPTYQVALVVLVQAITRRHAGGVAGVDELVERWFALVQAMELAFPRSDTSSGWSREELASACVLPAIRSRIMQVCDALRVSLAYRLPDLTHRGLAIHAADVVPAGEGNRVVMMGSLLLNIRSLTLPPSPESPAEVSPPAPSPSPTKRPRRSRSPAKPATPVDAPPAPPESTNDHTDRLFGAHIGRIELALRRGGPVMLIGPTATGKTTQALAAALRLGYGVEAVTLDEGWEAEDLFGSYTRTTHDHEWRFVPGPVTRWAERAAAGESVVLLIDELARGHKTVISAVMRLMNEHPRSAVEGMKLPLPDGDDGPFYVVDIRATQQRIVLPCSRVRIVATANQGEGYGGIDLSDPAFGRRFSGGWLHLTGYPADEAARILGDKLGLAPSAPLIRAMQQVDVQVLAYQKKEESLRATLDLATLIAWGRTARYLFDHATTPARGNAALAFQEAARDVWLDRICPLQGANLDPQVERALLEMVTAAATSLA